MIYKTIISADDLKIVGIITNSVLTPERVVWVGTGNTLTESDNLTWDNTNVRLKNLGITRTKDLNVTGVSTLTELLVQGGSAAKPTFRHSAGWGALRVAGSAGGSGAGFIFANNYSGTIEEKWSIYLDGSTDDLRFTAGPPETTASERLRIAADGKLLVGKNSAYGSAIAQVHNTSQYVLDLNLWSADANPGVLAFYKSRNATPGGATIVQDDDGIASLRFLGNDGANSREAGYIKAFVDGTPGTDDMPGRIVFGTTADGAPSATERLRIASTGQVLLGTTTPSGYSNRILTVAAADNDSSIEIRTATDHAG